MRTAVCAAVTKVLFILASITVHITVCEFLEYVSIDVCLTVCAAVRA